MIEILPLSHQVQAMIEAPPSKSHTLRALFTAALAQGETILKSPLLAQDQMYAIEALEKFGAKFEIKENEVDLIEDAFRDLAGNLTDDQYEKYQQGIILRQGEYFLEPCTVTTRHLKKKARKTPVKVPGVLDVKVKSRHSKRCVNEVIRRENMGYGGCRREQIQVIRRKGVPYYVLLERDHAGMQIPKDCFVKDGHLVTRESLVYQFDLSNGVGNPHVARDAIKISGGIFIRGTLRHNQHRMIKMRNVWHRVIKNTAIGSWSSSGNVD